MEKSFYINQIHLQKKKVKLIELSKTLFNETGQSTRSIAEHFDSQFKKKMLQINQ